ncbi:MAG: hypothetical protein U0869_24795 [Chloroflexota bacterium]
MEPWTCDRCRTVNGGGATACSRCGAPAPVIPMPPSATPPPEPSPSPAGAGWSGVAVVRSVQDDRVLAAAIATPDGRRPKEGEALTLEPFFQLEAPPRHPRLRRVARLWPVLVLLIVLLFFAIAGLSHSI